MDPIHLNLLELNFLNCCRFVNTVLFRSEETADQFMAELMDGNHRIKTMHEFLKTCKNTEIREQMQTVYVNVFTGLTKEDVIRFSFQLQGRSEDTLNMKLHNILALYRREFIARVDYYSSESKSGYGRIFRKGKKAELDKIFGSRMQKSDHEHFSFFVAGMSDMVFEKWLAVMEAHGNGNLLIKIKGEKNIMSSGRFPLGFFKLLKSKRNKVTAQSKKEPSVARVCVTDELMIHWAYKLLNKTKTEKLNDAATSAEVANSIGIPISQLSKTPNAIETVKKFRALDTDRSISADVRHCLKDGLSANQEPDLISTVIISDVSEIEEVSNCPRVIIVGSGTTVLQNQYNAIKKICSKKDYSEYTVIHIRDYSAATLLDTQQLVRGENDCVIEEPILITVKKAKDTRLVKCRISKFLLIAHYTSGCPPCHNPVNHLASDSKFDQFQDSLAVAANLIKQAPVLLLTDDRELLNKLIIYGLSITHIVCSKTAKKEFGLIVSGVRSKGVDTEIGKSSNLVDADNEANNTVESCGIDPHSGANATITNGISCEEVDYTAIEPGLIEKDLPNRILGF